jgi:membrane associated rhomboid family serine protease
MDMLLSRILDAPVSLGIILLTAAVSIWGFFREDFRDRHLLVPYDMLLYKEYWRVITSGFFHGNVLHLSLNLATFLCFGFLLEFRLGHLQVALLYFASLLLSNLAVTLIYRNDTAYEGSIGASGAISGVVLGSILCEPTLRYGFPVISNAFPAFAIPGYVIGGLFLIYSLMNAFRESDWHINHHAHLWGAVAGVLLTVAFDPQVIDGLRIAFGLA